MHEGSRRTGVCRSGDMLSCSSANTIFVTWQGGAMVTGGGTMAGGG